MLRHIWLLFLKDSPLPINYCVTRKLAREAQARSKQLNPGRKFQVVQFIRKPRRKAYGGRPGYRPTFTVGIRS
jgi:hypothetical protein